MQKYHKAVEEGAKSDRRVIAMQRELSASKSNNLNITSISNGQANPNNSHAFLDKKFSMSNEGKLSNTVINEYDTNMQSMLSVSP
jgi:hypothetical protein